MIHSASLLLLTVKVTPILKESERAYMATLLGMDFGPSIPLI
jgi:hypothetical protein